MISIQQVKSKAEVLGANIVVQGNGINVQMPLTKLQQKGRLPNDFICTEVDGNFQANIDTVYTFLCEWEEKWSLKNEIKRKEIETFVRNKLTTDDLWAKKALLLIYSHQTTSEQQIGHTTVHNNVGFTGVDSEFMSSLAEQLKRKIEELKALHSDWNETLLVKNAWMSAKQLACLHKNIKKYWKQVYTNSDEVKLLKMIKAAR